MNPRAKGKRVFVVSGVILLAVLMLTAWFMAIESIIKPAVNKLLQGKEVC